MGLEIANKLLRTDRERVISSFDFIDIAKNRAVEIFYPAQTDNRATKVYPLTNNQFPSSVTNMGIDTTSTTPVPVQDITFETLVEVPMIIEGDVIFSFPLAVDGDGTTTAQVYISGALLVSGANLTELGTVKGADFQSPGGVEAETYQSMKMTIPKTKIRGGEYLQAHVQTVCFNSGDTETSTVWLGWDPTGARTRGGTKEHDFGHINAGVNSQAKILIPINIDL